MSGGLVGGLHPVVYWVPDQRHAGKVSVVLGICR